MKIKQFVVAAMVLFFSYTTLSAQSIDKAIMYSKHGLVEQAKVELIEIVFSKSGNPEKAYALYLLGSIAFDENDVSVALDTWRELVAKYPETEHGILVKGRIDELAGIVGESVKESVDNAIALSYLRNGDFWSNGKGRTFRIDSSWIPNVESAVKWYDKTIAEFPKSEASRIAYQSKIRTLLGWEEPGEYGSSHGVKESFNKYMPKVVDTFKSFEKEHPEAPALQAIRYQIAQAYWNNMEWVKTREWLNEIIKQAGEGDSFYKDLAERRLKKVEY